MDSELKPYLYTRFGSTQYEFRFIVTWFSHKKFILC
jgi:hypothetical protein